MEFYALAVCLTPDAVQGIPFPQPLGEGRAVIGGMGLCGDQPDGAARGDVANATNGGSCGHPPTKDQMCKVCHVLSSFHAMFLAHGDPSDSVLGTQRRTLLSDSPFQARERVDE